LPFSRRSQSPGDRSPEAPVGKHGNLRSDGYSPDYCSKNEWIYENIGDNFSTHSYYAKKYGKLTLTFDDNYILSGYIFQEHQQGN